MLDLRPVLTWLTALTQTARTRARTLDRDRGWDRDRGAGIVETVVIIAALVAAAIVIVAILVTKAKNAANAVKTQ